MNVEVSQIDQALTGNGTAQGLITVASTTGILPGATGQLYQSTGGYMSVMVIVTDVPSATTLHVRIVATPFAGPAAGGPQANGSASAPVQTLTQRQPSNYGRSDVSAFTTANSAHFCQNAGIVRAEPSAQAAPLM